MSDLQGAIAGLNTVDIEGDPIDALDACLMVLELLEKPETVPDTQPVTPKYEFTEKVTPAARQRANNEAVAILRSFQNGDIDRLTDDQKAKLSRYTGTGGNLVGEDGLKGSAYEYYTPLPVAQSMWDLLKEQVFLLQAHQTAKYNAFGQHLDQTKTTADIDSAVFDPC